MKLIIIIAILTLILLSGCNAEGTIEMDDQCEENLKILGCDELLDCYDNCNGYPVIDHANNCRETFKMRIWKCYGGSQI